jgi:hypothetical protein
MKPVPRSFDIRVSQAFGVRRLVAAFLARTRLAAGARPAKRGNHRLKPVPQGG